MRHFSITVDIAAPADRVWAVMSDVERWHEWTPSITRVTLLRKGALAVGSRALVRQPKFPPALWRVTELVPGRSFTWVSVAPGLRVIGRHAVELTVNGTRAVLTLELKGMVGGLWGRLTRGITERYIAFEAAGLKARSEETIVRH
ncbi:MAG TPA: SRPBCC family protein [Vicinamibacterales bacterium]|jgi:uncharacterized protein YndB with AHSA1/START domain|nr:SRPBCC family protein [Vicinamibacterales bacterium]